MVKGAPCQVTRPRRPTWATRRRRCNARSLLPASVMRTCSRSGNSNRSRKRKPRVENKSAQSFEIRERRRFEIGTKSAVRTNLFLLLYQRLKLGWGARIRTWEWRNQNPLPYHLATPQRAPDHTCGSGADQSAGGAGVMSIPQPPRRLPMGWTLSACCPHDCKRALAWTNRDPAGED